ncbi:MAG: T9SS type A sorting domain-containing protein [Candidatus Stahlbacteria bacterium]|nr:T9SS type A sorting domain-containing protein [Candidatus Stahlbacteria bacterium]
MSKRICFALVGVMFLGSIVEAASRWSWTGFLSICRRGFSNAMLTDGRLMVMSAELTPGDDSFEVFNPATGVWTGDNLPQGQAEHQMGMLLPNGQVSYWCESTVRMYRYNPMTNLWDTTIANINWYDRGPATLLKNGEMLLMYDPGGACKLYNCWTDLITPTGSLNDARYKGVEVLLPDGNVLAAGGEYTSDPMGSELYNPVSGSWTRTLGQLNEPHYYTVAALLPTRNKVLIAGGGPGGYSRTEIYTIATQRWDTAGIDTLNTRERSAPAMVILPNGKPMIMGGTNIGNVNHKRSCEIYDIDAPTADQWQYTDSMQVPRSHFTASVLVTGKILVAGTYSTIPAQFPKNSAEIYDPSNPTWELKANLITARKCHTVTVLPIYHTTNCSTNVLIVGGEDASGTALKTCELYNYGENNTIATGDLNVARTHHCAMLFPPPAMQVIAIGGKNAGGATNSCEIYDVVNENWATTNPMGAARFDHSATLLGDGNILVTGGEGSGGTILNSGEVYSAGIWTPTTNMTTARTEHNAVILLDGRVMVIGGRNTGGTTNSTEIWNGTTWSTGPSLNTGRYLHTAVVLQSGRILVIGGRGNSGAIASCEIWDPAGGGWQYEGNLLAARYAHNSTLLYSGMVVTTGGTNNGTNYLGGSEIWDPAAERDTLTNRHNWKTSGFGTPKGYQASVLVPIVKPYLISIGGGTDGGGVINNIDRWDVGLGYISPWQSTISSHPSVTPISSPMIVQGTLFRGVSEADGGNYCHIVSSDHPVMTLLRTGGGNYQGNGGGDILYMPLSNNWNETQTNIYPPTNLNGYYKIWAVVNGIPTKWYWVCADVEENSKQGSFVPSVFPSPSMGSVMFKIGNVKVNTDITIYDCAGRIVRSITATPRTKEIKLNGLKTGIYFYRIENNLSTGKGKFVVL